MKELSIEQKAKRYDEAIEKFDVILNLDIVKESGTIFADDVRKILPELEESEDEKVRKALIKLVKKTGEGYENVIDGVSIENAISWLEKQGEQKPADTEKGTNGNERKTSIPEPPLTIKHAKEVMGIKQDYAWSEEDDRMYNIIVSYIPQHLTAESYTACINWFKSLKERVQPKQEWSEEDEQTFIKSVEALEDFGKFELADWLKEHKNQFLKPHNTWKPSDEQMETLENVRKILHTNDIYSKANNLMYNFEELIRTLKKLREK